MKQRNINASLVISQKSRWDSLTYSVYKLIILGLSIVLLLTGCSSLKSAFSAKRQIQLPLIASSQLNLDITAKPSPLIVFIYELRSIDDFANQDFFSLYTNAKTILGSNLIATQRIVLIPAMRQSLVWTLQADTHYLGVLAIYRNLDNTTWKQILPVTKGKLPSNIKLVFDNQGIQVKR